MKAKTSTLLLTALLCSTLCSAQTQPVRATIDASKTSAPISKYIYGQFLEHIGGIVNNNIWAEMLDDRKFYFPINSHPPAEPSGPSRRRVTLRHWMPISADEFATIDTDRPYVGKHASLVKLSSSEAHGIKQAGLEYGLGSTPQIIIVSPDGKVLQNWVGAYTGVEQAEVEKFFGVTLPRLTAEN